jgi:hypothetical protein
VTGEPHRAAGNGGAWGVFARIANAKSSLAATLHPMVASL